MAPQQWRGTQLPPGFGAQRFDFVLLDQLTSSQLLYLPVQVTDVSHCHAHRDLLALVLTRFFQLKFPAGHVPVSAVATVTSLCLSGRKGSSLGKTDLRGGVESEKRPGSSLRTDIKTEKGRKCHREVRQRFGLSGAEHT